MKKTAFMIVYNDADYVDYAIRSVKDWVDEMIIVEGAFEITMKAGQPPRSNDGTLNLINKHIDNKKIFLKHANLKEHKHHYDIGYQFAIKNGSDWAILVDSDEVWTKEAQMIADNYMKVFSGKAQEMRIHEYCFINDFRTWYPGIYPRFFKCIPGSKFVFDNEVHFNGWNRGAHGVLTIPNLKIFHYGYVRRKQRWQLKQDYMWEKDKNPNLKNYSLEGDSYTIPKDIPVYRFDKAHPKIMKDHPFHDKKAHEIIYGENNE